MQGKPDNQVQLTSLPGPISPPPLTHTDTHTHWVAHPHPHPHPAPLQPVWLHGSLGREAATGRGTVFAVRELLKAQGLGDIRNKSFVIQVGPAGTAARCRCRPPLLRRACPAAAAARGREVRPR